VFVLNFDFSLANWLGSYSTCIFSPKCGTALALERNGDLYSCYHFVQPEYLLGNIMQSSMKCLAHSQKQLQFGQIKSAALPQYYLQCEVLFACHGKCPKNSFIKTSDGKGGLNYLCGCGTK
jgi:uncharacterized protein